MLRNCKSKLKPPLVRFIEWDTRVILTDYSKSTHEDHPQSECEGCAELWEETCVKLAKAVTKT